MALQKLKNSPANAGDVRHSGLIPGPGRSPGGEHSNPFQYSCLENPTDRGPWWATVHGVSKSRTLLKQLSRFKADSYSHKYNWSTNNKTSILHALHQDMLIKGMKTGSKFLILILLFFRGSFSICSYRFGVFVERDESKSLLGLLHHHLVLEPPTTTDKLCLTIKRVGVYSQSMFWN